MNFWTSSFPKINALNAASFTDIWQRHLPEFLGGSSVRFQSEEPKIWYHTMFTFVAVHQSILQAKSCILTKLVAQVGLRIGPIKYLIETWVLTELYGT